MKRILILLIVAVLYTVIALGCVYAGTNKTNTTEATEDAINMETIADISASAIHDYSIVRMVPTTEGALDDFGTDCTDDTSDIYDTGYGDYESFIEEDISHEEESYEYYEEYVEDAYEYYDDEYADYITRETIIDYAWEVYGVSEEWTMWLIGTTHNEGYQGDRYLEYAWACEIINVYRDWSVWDLDCIWGGYYSIDHAFSGFYAADDMTLEMVWEALTDRDTRIVEVDGMISWYVPGYYLIYDSPVYNCQVWGS